MHILFNVMVASLISFLFMAGSPEARTVYLKDGAVLQAEAVRRSAGTVFVLVNHEAEVMLSESEVDLQKTFPKHAVRKKSSRRVKQAVKAPVMTGMSSAKAPATGQIPATKPATSAKKDTAGPVPAARTTAAGKPSPPAPVKRQESSPVQGELQKNQPAPSPAAKSPATTPPPPPTATAPTPPPLPVPPEATTPPKKIPLPGAPLPAKKIPALPTSSIFVIMGVVLLLIILLIASVWKVYEKAGQAGWKCLIPIYNYVVFLHIIARPVWWVILLFVPVVCFIILIVMHVDLARRFGKGVLYGLGLCILPFIFFPLLAFGDAAYE